MKCKQLTTSIHHFNSRPPRSPIMNHVLCESQEPHIMSNHYSPTLLWSISTTPTTFRQVLTRLWCKKHWLRHKISTGYYGVFKKYRWLNRINSHPHPPQKKRKTIDRQTQERGFTKRIERGLKVNQNAVMQANQQHVSSNIYCTKPWQLATCCTSKIKFQLHNLNECWC